MRKAAKVTSKGQVTVPIEIRRTLGLHPGDNLVFETEGNTVRVVPEKAQSPFGRYRGIGNPGIGSRRQAILKYFKGLREEA